MIRRSRSIGINTIKGDLAVNVNDAFFHGIAQQIRNVLAAMTEDEIDAGIDAFETGSSDWNNCFFARALAGRKEFQQNRGELGVAMALDLRSPYTSHGYNLGPVRTVYHAFDSVSTFLTRKEVLRLITDIRDQSRPIEVLNVLKQINFAGVAEKEIPENAFCT
jgi:hypothetical protein